MVPGTAGSETGTGTAGAIGNIRLVAGGTTATERVHFDSTSGTSVGYVDGLGSFYGTNFNATSDINYKTNIEHLDHPLDTLKKIEGYTYNWKPEYNKGDKKQYGVIAQQLEQAGLDLLVSGGNEMKSVNYLGIIPIMVEAIKEQQRIIDTILNNIS